MIHLNCNMVNRRLKIDLFGPHYVSTADDERMLKIEQAFQVVTIALIFGLALTRLST